MQNTTKRGAGLRAAALALVLSALGGSLSAAEQDTWYFGALGPLTGNAAQYGAQWKKGFDLALEEINASGGVRGHKLAYTFDDTQNDPKQTTAVAQKLVGDPRILVAVGDFSSTASMAGSPIFQRNGLVQLGITNSHPKFTDTGDYVWSNSLSTIDTEYLTAKYAADLGFKKVAVLHLNTDWGKNASDNLIAGLEKVGVEVVAREGYLETETNFRSIFTRLRLKKPEAIVLESYYTDAALIAQQVKSSGLNIPIVANASNHSPKFVELGGKSAEGVYVSSSFLVDDPQPRVKRYVDAFTAKYGEAPDLFATVAYDGVYVIAAALKEAGNDRAKIKEAFSTIKDIPSVIFGPVQFNPSTRRFDNPKGAQLVVKNGKFVPWDGAKPAK